MDCCSINIRHPLVVVLAAMLIAFASCDDHDSKEREECAESVVGLATCLPYVGGTAKSPTPDCCSSLKQVLNTNKKCVCVIIQDRNDPDLGLNINLTLALGLPQACNAPANISQCPALLGLAPDSPDAQIFYESGNGHVAEGPNDNVKPAAPSDITTPGSIVEQQNDDDDDDDDYASATGKRFVELKIFAGVLFLWSVDFVI